MEDDYELQVGHRVVNDVIIGSDNAHSNRGIAILQ